MAERAGLRGQPGRVFGYSDAIGGVSEFTIRVVVCGSCKANMQARDKETWMRVHEW